MEDQYYGGYNQTLATTGMGQSAVAITMKDKINLAVKQAEDRLAAAKRAREIFDKYPEIEELLNLMNRGLF